MLEVSEHLRLHPTTAHAAVSYLDRLQPDDNTTRFEWQMIATTCLFIAGTMNHICLKFQTYIITIAAKYNETETDVPCINQLESINRITITNEMLLECEWQILNRLDWTLTGNLHVIFLVLIIRFSSNSAVGRGISVELYCCWGIFSW